MMAPPRCFIIGRLAARMSEKAPFRLVSSCLSQSSSFTRMTRPSTATPALLTSTSRRPCVFTTFSTAPAQAVESDTSKRTASPLPPAAWMRPSVSCAAASLPA